MGLGGVRREDPYIGVIGAGACSVEMEEMAAELGREIARHNGVLVCGGLGGVMAAAARGAKEMGGYTIGILPGPSIHEANPYIDFAIATNMGHARNAIITQTSEVLIAVSGGYGTLSEIGLALKMGKGVIALLPRFHIAGVRTAQTPESAVKEALTLLGKNREAF